MKKTNFNQLNLAQRQTIQYMIDKGHNFTEIAKAISKDRTTISKEIKRNRYVKSYFFDAFDPNGINTAISKCSYLLNPPYVCNQCNMKNRCNKQNFITMLLMLKVIMKKNNSKLVLVLIFPMILLIKLNTLLFLLLKIKSKVLIKFMLITLIFYISQNLLFIITFIMVFYLYLI